MGFQKVLDSLRIAPTSEKHQVTMVLALGLMIQDIMCAVEIEPDQCPPGVPEWVALSQLICSCPTVEQKTSKGTKDNQAEGTLRPHRGMKRKVPEYVGEW